MKCLSLLLFVLFAVSSLQAKQAKNKSDEIEILSSWKVVASDKQTFLLYEEKADTGKLNWLGFERGHNQQRSFPVMPVSWKKWKTALVHMIDSYPTAKSCGHPIVFEIRKKNSDLKTKEICIEELTKSEQQEFKNLISEWNDYLYEK